MTKVLVVVPLRLKSQRIPEKVLKPIAGIPLATRTVKRVLKACEKLGSDVKILIAVDDSKTEKLLKKQFPSLTVLMTDIALSSGTDRVFSAVELFLKDNPEYRSELKGIINVQGDMPFLGSAGLQSIIQYYSQGREDDLKSFPITTLAQPWPEEQKLEDLGGVKVIMDRKNQALYFSRYPIPYSRNPRPKKHPSVSFLHIGVYGYTLECLARFCSQSPVDLELYEGLEQLRAMWLGIPILVLKTTTSKIESFRGIDTPQDLRWAQNFARRKKKK